MEKIYANSVPTQFLPRNTEIYSYIMGAVSTYIFISLSSQIVLDRVQRCCFLLSSPCSSPGSFLPPTLPSRLRSSTCIRALRCNYRMITLPRVKTASPSLEANRTHRSRATSFPFLTIICRFYNPFAIDRLGQTGPVLLSSTNLVRMPL